MDYGCVCCLSAPDLWSCLDLKSIVCGLFHGTSSAIAIAIAIAAGCFCRIASHVWSLNFAHDQITVIVLFLNLPVTG